MKYTFGETSERRLSTVRQALQRVCRRALSYGIMDIAIVEGHRSKARQDKMFREGKSKVQWPHGKHNAEISEAVDVAPCINGKVSWKKEHCLVLSGIMLAAAEEELVPLRWGGNWDMDGEPVTDQGFQDFVHYELIKK